MGKPDLRSQPEAVKLTFRTRAIHLLKSGKKKKDIASILGVDANTITHWSNKEQYRRVEGEKAWRELRG